MDKILYNGNRRFSVLSSDNSKYYEVDLNNPSCDCIGFKYYKKCKHLVQAQTFEIELNKILGGNKAEKILEYLTKEDRWVDSTELIKNDLFNDNAIDSLKASMDIIENKGRYRVLK